MLLRPPTSTLCPSTTPSRSRVRGRAVPGEHAPRLAHRDDDVGAGEAGVHDRRAQSHLHVGVRRVDGPSEQGLEPGGRGPGRRPRPGGRGPPGRGEPENGASGKKVTLWGGPLVKKKHT